MINEAVILAGGLGTRLRDVVPDLPKCMAPVAGKPFLYYLIRYLEKQGIRRFIFCLGYRHEVVEEFLRNEFYLRYSAEYACSIEDEPLGTGGAVLKAAAMATSSDLLVVNGDTFFAVSLKELSSLHAEKKADCSLALKPMTNSKRYGVVDMDSKQKITAFREKQFYKTGLINGGVYALNVASFTGASLPDRFSFETEYLEAFSSVQKFYGCVQDSYFIDIGVPDDYQKANMDFRNFSI